MRITPTVAMRTLALAGLVLQPAVALSQDAAAGPASSAREASAVREAGSGAVRSPASAPTPAQAAALGTRPWTAEEYRLGPGDKLRVEVYHEPQLSQSLQVRPDGMITLPLVGDIQAAGRSAAELREALTIAFSEYLTNPVVTAIVQEAVANQVYVIGEVTNPGVQTLLGPITVLQALAQAGGLREFANQRNIRILRTTGNGVETLTFNYRDAVNGRAEPILLRPGDTVVVP
jgi:polysaccharide biosynthesis/export protein